MTSSLFPLDTVLVNDVRFNSNLVPVKYAVYDFLNYSSLRDGIPFKSRFSPCEMQKLFLLQFLFLSSSCFFSLMISRRCYEPILNQERKPCESINRYNICDLKWQIRQQRNVRWGENRKKLSSHRVNFQVSTIFYAFRRLTKSFVVK